MVVRNPFRSPRPASLDGTGAIRWGFVAGVALVTVGVLLQLQDMSMMLAGDAGMAHPGSRVGMPMWTPAMTAGMLLVAVGMVVAARSLFRNAPRPRPGAAVSLDAIEDGRLRPAHWLTFLALLVALVEDIMKPLTIGFVLPGLRQEYGISLAESALLPLVALTGTAVGSAVWGVVADRYGRRAALLLATLLFAATAACGLMPSFEWNLVMCFLMGSSAGGLLPIAFTLIAELTPRRHRGWTAVLLGAAGGLGGYLAASAAAYYLEPVYGWRALWLIGLPSGLILISMTPLIPESPLHLLRIGRRAEAEAVLARYGLHIREVGRSVAGTGDHLRSGFRALVRRYPVATALIVMVGVVWGLINFGFLLLLPGQLRAEGMTGGAASGLLTRSTLYSAPVLALVAALYARWRGRRSLSLFTAAAAVALGVIAVWNLDGGDGLLVAALGLLVLAVSAINAMLLPYAAEIYPTAMRGIGTGLAAAATKFGGIIGPPTMLLLLRIDDGYRVPGLILGLAAMGAAVLLLRFAPEPAVGGTQSLTRWAPVPTRSGSATGPP